jgi:hypothetical protein
VISTVAGWSRSQGSASHAAATASRRAASAATVVSPSITPYRPSTMTRSGTVLDQLPPETAPMLVG